MRAVEHRPRFNLLLFMTDQQRWDALGCSGGWVDTPTIDALAARGVRFANAYTNAPVCIPARVSLALGRYPHEHGVVQNKPYTLPPTRPTWMRAIRDAGYSTSVFGKIHLHPNRGDLRERQDLVRAYGFDHVDEIAGPRASMASRSNLTDLWSAAGVLEAYKADLKERNSTKPWLTRPSPLPLDLYPDVYVGHAAASYLRTLRGREPWFCMVSFSGPHEPWDAPEPYASRYDPSQMPAPVEPVEYRHKRPRGHLDSILATRRVAFEPGDISRLRANYAGNVSLIDDQIGEVIRAVEEGDQLDRTVVVFVSDHGEMNGDYGLLYKGNFLNGASRIPFIVSHPAHEWTAGAIAETPVELIDVGATLAELAGATLPKRSSARSVLPVLVDPSRVIRDIALVEHQGEAMAASPYWKLGVNSSGDPYLLFNLLDDPSERRNLAGLREYAAVEEDLRDRLKHAVESAGVGRRR
jgi:arylsulfatase